MLNKCMPDVHQFRLMSIVFVVSFTTLLSTASAEHPPAELRSVFEQFRSLTSIHFTSQVELNIVITPIECVIPVPEWALNSPIHGHYNYWADGDHYRVDSHIEADKFPGLQTQVAYNGKYFQILRSDGTLSFSKDNTRQILPVLPNPLLELLQFRYPVTDGNSDFLVRLEDVKKDKVPAGFWTVPWTTIQEGANTFERAIYPGGKYEATEYVYHINAAPGERNKPLRIDRITPSGKLTSAEFTDYRQADVGGLPAFWPHQVILQTYNSEGGLVGKISYTITNLSIDGEIAPSSLLVPAELATKIWSDESSQFVEAMPD